MSSDAARHTHPARLREWSAADGDWYIAQLGDPEIERFTTEHADTTVEDFQAALDELNSRPDLVGFAIVEAATGEFAGNLAANLHDGVAEIHYWIAPGYRRRGLASDAVGQMCEWIAANWPGCDLVLEVDADNRASQGVAEKLGFEWRRDRDRLHDTKTLRWYTRSRQSTTPR
jgi:[ribosomal protein S5]-alanine N-acetyltransferase